jgi:regulator of protease activity HflC (stomatin/prohibitin superfamily)
MSASYVRIETSANLWDYTANRGPRENAQGGVFMSNDGLRWDPPPLPRKFHIRMGPSLAVMALLVLVFFLPLFVWFGCRIEPGPDQIAVLIRKTGRDLPTGEILALEPGQKGIQLDVLAEGRYFKNPYTWDWRISRVTDIPAGRLGVMTRLFGKDLPPGQIVAAADGKGIVAEVLRPGKYRVNPYAYAIELFDATSIRPGSVGVVTSLIGQDILGSELPATQRNTLLVGEEMKGVVAPVLEPGTYYLNPYLVNVVEVNLQSQRFTMSGEDAISFLTMDGFSMHVEGTIEFNLVREKAAEVTHRVGDMDDILRKVILPRARGFSRIEGSKHPAINFIVGETRQEFQNDLEAHLAERCKPWGVSINSVLIRNIQPPDEIASISRDREVAVQNALKFEQQIAQARSKAELTKQEMLALQNKEKVAAETAQIRAVIGAKQELSVLVTAANRELEVARIENEAATFQVQAKIAAAEADRDVIRLGNEAQAAVFRSQVEAFGSGMNLARYTFYTKVGPNISSVLAGDQPEGIGGIFLPLLPDAREVKP